MRLDKWLWQARFFKSRSLSAKAVSRGHMRVNSVRTDKPAHRVGVGDTLTFPQGRVIRVVRVLALGERRGPSPEARMLYEDLTTAQETSPSVPRYDGGGRPTKKDRRRMEQTGKARLE
ncbi:RNA-binding S4 domain-containing protein [Rhodovulum imhoffii]|uniref:RNA-binding S4 domain-containing protein n=1 Tax=Rhodovulum imhoffii TaxID=365340 RepID=UPI000D3AA774|nr:RNA-binding protein S4 [Rhodovulum imhoffii]